VVEGYKLQLERGSDMDILHIVNTKNGKRTEVRGKPGYESGNYDADDKLHKLLDKIGKAANISELVNGEPVGINPNHPDGERAKKDTDKAFNEDKDYMHGYCHEWALNDIKENPNRVLYARTGFHYDDEYEEVDHIFTVDPKTGKAYDVRGEFANADALLADHDFGADEIDIEQIDVQNIKNWIADGELKKISINEDAEQKPHLYLDMDGVQADFFNSWAKWHNSKNNTNITNYREIGDADAQLASIVELSSQGPEFIEEFFANLPVLSGFKQLITWIKQNNIPYTILSAPLRNQHQASIAGKKKWLSKHNPGAVDEIFTGRKESYAINKQTKQPNVLVDDHGKYIDRWTARGGIGVKHTNKNPQATIDQLEKIYNQDITEDSPVDKLKRLYSVTRHEPQYAKASETLVKVLKRKQQENDGKLKHTIGYYAQQVGKTFRNVDYRALMDYFEKHGYDKQIVDEKWSNKYKKSIDCSNPKGFSQKAHCAGKKKK